VPYTPTPVRRDHPCKTESIEIATNTVMKEVPENTIIDTFIKKMSKAGLTPPTEIIADGNIHLISVSSDTEYYVLHPETPAIGLYGCKERDINKIWSNKHQVEAMNDIEKAAYEKKAKQMRRLRDKALSANQTSE